MVERIEYPKQLMHVRRSEEGMNMHWMRLKSTKQNSDEYYGIRWETLSKRRYYKAPENPVKPSLLKLYKFSNK